MQEDKDKTNSGQDADMREQLRCLREELSRSRQEFESVRERLTSDLDRARRELAQARAIQESLAEQLHVRAGRLEEVPPHGTAPAVSADRLGVIGLWRAGRRMMRSGGARSLQRDMRLLHESDVFDEDWYLTEYPDVAGTGIDPAEHYLRFGALEGRDPGPLFRTAEYLRDHPELVGGQDNPLVHFLRSRQSPAQR